MFPFASAALAATTLSPNDGLSEPDSRLSGPLTKLLRVVKEVAFKAATSLITSEFSIPGNKYVYRIHRYVHWFQALACSHFLL